MKNRINNRGKSGTTMNESDEIELQKRLSQIHELQKKTEKLSIDDDQETETGYVTDSSTSMNLRKSKSTLFG